MGSPEPHARAGRWRPAKHRTGTAYNFSVDQGAGTGSYDIDIQTGSGYQNYVTGIQLGSGNSFTLAESTLSRNETNFVRIRGANPAITNYSQIVSLVYDPSISSSSQNPVRALSVSRSGTNVALKWEVAGTTTKKFRVYFRLADGSTTYLLSPVSLPSSTRTLTLSDQSLTQVCGDFFVKIVLSESPLTESAASPYNRLGSAQSGITGPLTPCGGGSGSNPISYTFANSYHHRDHLGSLRAETDEAGNRSVKRDYYAFGIEMLNGFESSAQAATRRQFTEAERGVYNGLDYMMARFCSGNAGRFLSPDVVVGNAGNPQSWNRYSYVMNSPMNYLDPSGKIYINPNQEAGPHQSDDPITRTGSQERTSGYYFYYSSAKPGKLKEALLLMSKTDTGQNALAQLNNQAEQEGRTLEGGPDSLIQPNPSLTGTGKVATTDPDSGHISYDPSAGAVKLASALVHESVHSGTVNGAGMPDPQRYTRDTYVTFALNEEARGFDRQTQFNRELVRELGSNPGMGFMPKMQSVSDNAIRSGNNSFKAIAEYLRGTNYGGYAQEHANYWNQIHQP